MYTVYIRSCVIGIVYMYIYFYCDYCGFHTENANHFFFECPKYNDERNCFFHQISMLNLQKPITLDLLLYGDNDVSYDENVKLFKLVHEYIKKSRRFV